MFYLHLDRRDPTSLLKHNKDTLTFQSPHPAPPGINATLP